MSTKYDLIYSNYDFQPNITSQTTTNYFEKQITEGLPFFHQNKLQNTLKNNYFNDSNTRLKNENNKNIATNEKIDMSDIEAKKIIEREMKPYLSYMKKELNLIVEQFSKNLDDKNDIINDITSIQKEIESIKTQNDIIKNNLDQKILKNNEILNSQDKKINNIQSNINNFNQLFSNQSYQNNQIPNIIFDISQIKEKINLVEKNNENVLPEIKLFTENLLSTKFNNFMIEKYKRKK